MSDVSKALKKLSATLKPAFKKLKAKPAEQRGGGGQITELLANEIGTLDKFTIGVSEAGDPYVSLTLIIQTPERYQGMPQSQWFYFNGTETTPAEKRLDDFLNLLKLLGADFSEVDDLFVPGVLDGILEQMCVEKVNCVYHTWKSNKGRFNLQIDGLSNQEVVAEEPTVEEDDEPTPKGKVAPKPVTKVPPKTVAKKVTKPIEEPEEEPSVEEDGSMPAVGEVYGYQPNKKAEIEECRVTEIDAENGTVSLLRLRDKKVFSEVDVSLLHVG